MRPDYEKLYTKRAKRLVASEIREILKMMKDPELISFAGGNPNPDTFPVKVIWDIAQEVLTESPTESLQYSVTEGYPPLRETLAAHMKQQRVECTGENVLVVSGAQQAIDLTAQIFLEEGRHAITESPSFLAAILDFKTYAAEIDAVKLDGEGMLVDHLEDELKRLSQKGVHPTMLYTVTNFQNPTGVTLSESRRKKLVGLANDFDFIILEDDPYGKLRFEGEDIPPIKAFDDSGRVIYASSFSKILSPGLRLGWVVADTELIRKMAIIKQTTDVHTNVLSQRIADEYLTQGHLERQLPFIRELYGRKRNVMLSAIEKFFPPEARWTRPQGGMFVWVTLPENVDTREMLPEAVERKVAYVHGRLFYADGCCGSNEMRMSYSHPPDDLITEGVKRLGELLRQKLK